VRLDEDETTFLARKALSSPALVRGSAMTKVRACLYLSIAAISAQRPAIGWMSDWDFIWTDDQLITFPIKCNERSSLIAIEAEQPISLAIKCVYYISGTRNDAV
jgi:hypothetical protein